MRYTHKMWTYFADAIQEELDLQANYRFEDECRRERAAYRWAVDMSHAWKWFKKTIRATIDIEKYEEGSLDYLYELQIIEFAQMRRNRNG